jgi:hypothetical protein
LIPEKATSIKDTICNNFHLFIVMKTSINKENNFKIIIMKKIKEKGP